MDVNISRPWKELLGSEFDKPYFAQLVSFVKNEYAAGEVFPSGKNVFRAFDMCAPDDVKVVVIGQDPYHGVGQANGLCFSVSDGVRFPPSLVNIFNEICRDTGAVMPGSGNLERWAEQGVLLLNSVLTVRAHEAASHGGRGWEQFTDAVVAALAAHRSEVVYMLWGAYAQKKGAIVDANCNCILKSVHPSPLSAYRGFIGCGHFSQANRYLTEKGIAPIVW